MLADAKRNRPVEASQMSFQVKILERLVSVSELPSSIAKRIEMGGINIILTYILAYAKQKKLTRASDISIQMKMPVSITKRLGWRKMPTINIPITRKFDYGFWYTRSGILGQNKNLFVIEAKSHTWVSMHAIT